MRVDVLVDLFSSSAEVVFEQFVNANNHDGNRNPLGPVLVSRETNMG